MRGRGGWVYRLDRGHLDAGAHLGALVLVMPSSRLADVFVVRLY